MDACSRYAPVCPAQARNAFGGKLDDESLKTLFAEIDKDKSGSIDATELQTALRQHGYNADNRTIQLMMTSSDANGDRKLSFDEFKTSMQQHMK